MQPLSVVAEVKLTYSTHVKPASRQWIKNSKDIYQILLQIWDAETVELREEFKILLLNRANRLLGFYNLSAGGVSGTVVDPKLVFSTALKANASGIILAHNHPSGSTTPSPQDISLTKKIREGGKLLEIQLLDHLIYTVDGYLSMADEGML